VATASSSAAPAAATMAMPPLILVLLMLLARIITLDSDEYRSRGLIGGEDLQQGERRHLLCLAARTHVEIVSHSTLVANTDDRTFTTYVASNALVH